MPCSEQTIAAMTVQVTGRKRYDAVLAEEDDENDCNLDKVMTEAESAGSCLLGTFGKLQTES